MSLGRDKEVILVRAGDQNRDLVRRHTLLGQFLFELLPLLIKQVAEPLEEQHAKDVFLILRGIHVAAKVIAGTEEKTGKLTESEFTGHEDKGRR